MITRASDLPRDGRVSFIEGGSADYCFRIIGSKHAHEVHADLACGTAAQPHVLRPQAHDGDDGYVCDCQTRVTAAAWRDGRPVAEGLWAVGPFGEQARLAGESRP